MERKRPYSEEKWFVLEPKLKAKAMEAAKRDSGKKQHPEEKWFTMELKTKEMAKEAQKQGKGKDMVLLASAIISTAWLIISLFAVAGELKNPLVGEDEIEKLGYMIGTYLGLAIMIPYFLLTAIGAIFNWVAYGTGGKGFALTAGILFSVSLLFGFSFIIGIIPCVVLSFVGYARLKKAG